MNEFLLGEKSRIAVLVALISAQGVSAEEFVLEEIVVTSQRREQTLIEVPISVAVLSSDTLEKSNVSNTQELVRITPSVTFRPSFNASVTSFAIRGVTTSTFIGSLQPSVITVLDDVPMARAGQSVFDLADIERVEILRGPQGTLFGINATGGAISITTAKPEENFRGYVELTYEENDVDGGGYVKGMMTGSLSNNINGRLNFMYKDYGEHTENITPNSRAPGYGEEERKGVSGTLDIAISDSMSLLLKADHETVEVANSTGALELRRYYPGFAVDGQVFGAENFPGVFELDSQRSVDSDNLEFVQAETTTGWATYENSGFSAIFDWQVADNAEFKSITSYRFFDGNNNIDLAQAPIGVVVDRGNNVSLSSPETGMGPYQRGTQPRAQDTFTQEFRLSGLLGNLEYVTGFYYQNFQDDWESYTPVQLTIPAFSIIGLLQEYNVSYSEFDTYAVYFDGTYQIADDLSVFAGLRYTYEDVEYSHTLWNQISAFDFPTSQAFISSEDASADYKTLDQLVNSLAENPSVANSDVKNSRSDEKLTGRLGLSYRFSDDLSGYVSYTTGFKGLGLNATPTGVSPGTIEVDPEEIEAFEIGMKSYLFNRRLSLNLAMFYQELENSQQGTLIVGTPLAQLENVGGLEAKGIEIESTFSVSEYLVLSGAFSYVDAEMTDFQIQCYSGQVFETDCNQRVLDANGNLVAMEQSLDGASAPHTPEIAYIVAADFTIPIDDLPFDSFGRVSYSWQDDVSLDYTLDPFLAQESFGMLDISLGMTDKMNRYEITAFVRNATDERWSASKTNVNALLFRSNSVITREGAGRFYGLKARWNF